MTYKFKTGDTGLTRSGRPYRVIADDVKGDYPIVALIVLGDGEQPMRYQLDGSYWQRTRPDGIDLKPPAQHRYINVYEGNDGVMHLGGEYSTRGEADKSAASGCSRPSCIRVELVRGRFDD